MKLKNIYGSLVVLSFFLVASFYFISCSSDNTFVTQNNQTLLFSDDFRFFDTVKWTSTGTIHIDSTDGYPLPCVNTGSASITNVGTFSTSQDLTVSAAYRKLDTASTNPVTIRFLDNGSQYIAASFYKDNINIYIPSQGYNQAFNFPIDTAFHTFSNKITTDGTNKFYRDNVLFSTVTISGTHLLSMSLSSVNVAARFDNAVITTP